jgi:hypothetical protein
MLFVLYISDLPLGINIDSNLLCADNTSILMSGPTIQEVQSKSSVALYIINKWFMTNGLPLNVKKTKELNLSLISKKMPIFKLPVGMNQYKRN